MTQQIHPNELAAQQGMKIGAGLMLEANNRQQNRDITTKHSELAAFMAREIFPKKSSGELDSSTALQMIQQEGQRLGIDPDTSMKMVANFGQAEKILGGPTISDVLKQTNQQLDIQKKAQALEKAGRTPRQKAFEEQEEETALTAFSRFQTLHTIAMEAQDEDTERDIVDQIAEKLEEQFDIDLPGIAFHGKIGTLANLASLAAKELKKTAPYQTADEAQLSRQLLRMFQNPRDITPDIAFRGLDVAGAETDIIAEQSLLELASEISGKR